MKANSIKEAWELANEIFPSDYEHDVSSSERAGYPIYRSTVKENYYDRICDLGCRLEVVLDSTGKNTVNIWIEDSEEKHEVKTENAQPEAKADETQSVSEERKATARRIQRLCYIFTSDYIDDMKKASEEEEACKRMKENPDGEIKIMVLTGDQNAKVSLECMTECVKAVRLLLNPKEDIDDWMLAGINAMIDKSNEAHGYAFDLPTAINGVMLAQYR